MPIDQLSTTHNLTGAILAGGQGSRMGGIDKGWALHQERPLIEHAVAALESQVPHLIISANRSLLQYERLGFPVIKDQHEGFAGPLAGIYAASRAAKTEWIITVPVDSPYVPGNYVQTMRRKQHHSNADVIVATDGQYPQPVFLLMKQSLANTIAKCLDAGMGKIMTWVKSQHYDYCEFDQERMFENKNSREDLMQ